LYKIKGCTITKQNKVKIISLKLNFKNKIKRWFNNHEILKDSFFFIIILTLILLWLYLLNGVVVDIAYFYWSNNMSITLNYRDDKILVQIFINILFIVLALYIYLDIILSLLYVNNINYKSVSNLGLSKFYKL
jgi:hypothetical protein